MIQKFCKVFFSAAFVFVTALSISAQAENRSPSEHREKDDVVPKSMKDMLVRRRIEQDKKDHDELIRRGDEALEISAQLEESFSQHNQLSALDKERLDNLAGILKKIRRDIGAEDDDLDKAPAEADDQDAKPSTLENAFKVLQSTTVKLVDELKRTTRFTVSAVAIQSSNTLLRIVRFIRTGK